MGMVKEGTIKSFFDFLILTFEFELHKSFFIRTTFYILTPG